MLSVLRWLLPPWRLSGPTADIVFWVGVATSLQVNDRLATTQSCSCEAFNPTSPHYPHGTMLPHT